MVGVLVLRLIAGALIVALVVGSLQAQAVQGVFAGMGAIADQPWGPATFLDLAAGLLIAALWMAVREPRRALLPLWWVGVLLTGNMGVLVFVLRCTIGAQSLREVFLGRRQGGAAAG
jgi:hypothetical protein